MYKQDYSFKGTANKVTYKGVFLFNPTFSLLASTDN